MTITSDPVSPIWPVGSNVTLNCTVELSPAVDVPVTVNTVWTGPAGFMTTNTAQPVMGSTTTYTSTAMVSLFGRNQTGKYTCTATVSSTSSFLTGSGSQYGIARVTVGKVISYTCTTIGDICRVLYFYGLSLPILTITAQNIHVSLTIAAEPPTIAHLTTTVAPTTNTPTDAPTTDAPITHIPTTALPATYVPTTDIPTSNVPMTEVPTTDSSPTEAPKTDAPITDVTTSEAYICTKFRDNTNLTTVG